MRNIFRNLVGFAVVVLLVFVLASFCKAGTDVVFGWGKVADAATYRVYQSQTSGSYVKATGKVCDVSTLTCTVSGLPDGKTYFWVATAVDIAGNESAYSTEVKYTTGDTTPPIPPPDFKTLSVNVTVNISLGQ